MNIRQIRGQTLNLPRSFGTAPTAAWQAFRKVVPWQAATRPDLPPGTLAYSFLQANPASLFYPPAANPPARAAKRKRVSKAKVRAAVGGAKYRTAHFRFDRARALNRFLRRQAHQASTGQARLSRIGPPNEVQAGGPRRRAGGRCWLRACQDVCRLVPPA